MAEETGLTLTDPGENEAGNETLNGEATGETGQIREQIEETRAKMGETIEAIQEKLSFSNISEQVTEQVGEQLSNIYRTAKDTAYKATVKKAGQFMRQINEEFKRSDLIKQIGAKPLPLFFIALGAGLLIFEGKKSRRKALKHRPKPRTLKPSNGAGGDRPSMLKAARDSIAGAAGTTYESVGNLAGSAYESVTDLADGTLKKAGELGGQVQERYEYYIEENPLVIGAVALAVGAAVGLAIPSTEYESERLGEMRANLIARVGESVTATLKNTIAEKA